MALLKAIKPIPTIDVRSQGGAPCLHVDGQPQTGLAFWHAPGAQGTEEWQLFARCGVHLFQLDLGLWPESIHAADPSANWNAVLETTLAADPSAGIWIRLALEPPAWWLEQFPDEAQIHYDEQNSDCFQWRVAYASPLWQKQVAERLTRFIRHMEQHWGDRVWCYQLNAGDCGEWAYSWKPVLSGYAPAQIRAWRDWLRGRYTDESALRTAWGDSTVTFATAVPPLAAARCRPVTWPRASHLIDPSGEQRLVDWLHFHGQVQAEALASLAAVSRQTLVAVGRRKLIGAFHGYHIWPYGSAYGPCNTGFSDLDPVLHSPDLDLLCTPLAYIHRNPGGLYSHHDLAASVRLNGKLFFTEDDTFTHRANWTPWRYCCRNATETLQILQRNLAGVLSEGGSQWWMDHDSQRWYCDDQLKAGLTVMRRVADTALQYPRGSCAEVVFVSNERSFRILRQESALIDLLWPKQQTELLRIGAPVDFVRVRDLGLAEASGDSARWKFVVIAGCLWLDDDERALLKRVLMRDGKHLLFLHGQGICNGARLDLQFTSELTGINLQTYPHGGPCRAEMMLAGQHFSWGTDKEIAPILYAEDAQAETLGWLERQYYPALVRRQKANWTTLWSAVPGLPAQLLGQLAEAAGVHRYLVDGSQVLANAGLLAVHAAGAGSRTLCLPEPRHLVDAFTGADLGVVREIALDMQRGETQIWHQQESSNRPPAK